MRKIKWPIVVAALSAGLFLALKEMVTSPSNQSSHPVKTSVLLSECQELQVQAQPEGKSLWTAGDPLPPATRSLSPQYVQLVVTPEASVVDIQISGGFSHRGFLVVLSSREPGYLPKKGRGWKMTSLGDGVFEYEE